MTRGFGFEKVIWISRRNQLSQAISRVIAQQTGVWISGAQPKGESKFDYDAIVRSAQYIRNGNINWRDYVSKIPLKNKMNILYEDLLSDEAVRNEVQSFLKLKTKLIPAERTRKQSSEVNAAWQRRFVDEVTDNDRWILEPPDWLQ
jgi:LPS sulfotransferase NodH